MTINKKKKSTKTKEENKIQAPLEHLVADGGLVWGAFWKKLLRVRERYHLFTGNVDLGDVPIITWEIEKRRHAEEIGVQNVNIWMHLTKRLREGNNLIIMCIIRLLKCLTKM